MILIIDNYDSFVHNLARYVRLLGVDTVVKRNDALSLAEIAMMQPSHIIISPGPCTPNEAGLSMEIIREYGATIPLLGVCLGHQAIGQVFGAKVMRANWPMHGKASIIEHDNQHLFHGLANPFFAGRYHSLIVSETNFPDCLTVTARCDRGEIMSIAHRVYPIFGVQFHPESVLTEGGLALLRNFVFKTESLKVTL